MPLSADVDALSAVGQRVRVDTVDARDIPTYRRAVQESRERIRPWNPVNPEDLAYHVSRQSDSHRTFLIRALPDERRGSHDVVGKVNVTGITRGRAFSCVLGYDAYDPYAGRGLFAEGLRLVVDLALGPQPRGLGLHRVEAAVQPGNLRSAGLLRSLGFRRCGYHPRYLWLGDASGRDDWRDHVVYSVDRMSWPAEPYGVHPHDRPVVAVASGPQGVTARDVQAARALAVELGVPVLRDTGGSWTERLADAVTGAVVLTDAATARTLRLHLVVTAHELSTAGAVTQVALQAADLAHG